MRIVLAGDSKKVRDMILRDVKRTTMQSFFRSIGDLRETDLSAQLCSLQIPALGVYGARDNIVSPDNAALLARGAHFSEIAMMDQSRHFPMTDEPGRFVSVMSHFLADAA
jgi:pimeloyl-ACP methyl ester carboxylesterase